MSETLVTTKDRLFEDITGYSFRGVNSFHEQLLKGNPWWRSRLDSAAGIDIYGNNGIAVGDIDNDGWDEIYVCQPGGLPNRLYKNRGDGTFTDITHEAGVDVLDDCTSALFVDFRNSGHQDLVVPAAPVRFCSSTTATAPSRTFPMRFISVPRRRAHSLVWPRPITTATGA